MGFDNQMQADSLRHSWFETHSNGRCTSMLPLSWEGQQSPMEPSFVIPRSQYISIASDGKNNFVATKDTWISFLGEPVLVGFKENFKENLFGVPEF